MWLNKFIKDNLGFFFPFFLCLFAGAVLIYLYSKDIIFIAVNSRYSPAGDLFFQWYTHVGDGATSLLLSVLLLLFVSKEKGIVLSVSHVITIIPVQIIKHFGFTENHRPRAYFWQKVNQLHFIDGVDILLSNSFPSGHTATAFSMFLVLSFWVKNQLLSLLFFVMAFLVGYSRMYLAQHFFADVYAGGAFAVAATTLVIWFFNEKLKLQERNNLNKGFFSKLN